MNHTTTKPVRYALATAALAVTALSVGVPMANASHNTDHLSTATPPSASPAADEIGAAARAAAAQQSLARAKAEAARAAKVEAARKAAAARANRKARAAKAKAAAAARAWIRPMRGDLTSTFGYRWGTVHAGIDISNGGGTPVYAAAAGVVAEAACTSASCSHPGSLGMSGYGNKVDIQHAGGVMTRYGHLTRYVVRTGQRVTAGQLIGYEGATGNVTGPHLHLEVLIGGEAVDPIPFFTRKGVNLRNG